MNTRCAFLCIAAVVDDDFVIEAEKKWCILVVFWCKTLQCIQFWQDTLPKWIQGVVFQHLDFAQNRTLQFSMTEFQFQKLKNIQDVYLLWSIKEARELWLNCFGSFICFVLFLPWRIDVSKLGCSVRQKRRLNQLRRAMFYICVKSEGWALPAEWRRRLWPSRCQRTSTLATKGLYTPLRLEAPLLYSAFDPGGPPLLGYTQT